MKKSAPLLLLLILAGLTAPVQAQGKIDPKLMEELGGEWRATDAKMYIDHQKGKKSRVWIVIGKERWFFTGSVAPMDFKGVFDRNLYEVELKSKKTASARYNGRTCQLRNFRLSMILGVTRGKDDKPKKIGGLSILKADLFCGGKKVKEGRHSMPGNWRRP